MGCQDFPEKGTVMIYIPKLLKPKELCSIFGVKVKTIYAMLYRKEIPGAFQLNSRNWYIDEEVLLKELEKKATAKIRSTGIIPNPNSDRHGIA